MSTPLKPWESSTALANKGQILRNSHLPSASLRSAPTLPPRPQRMSNSNTFGGYSGYPSFSNSYNYGSYGTMGWPGRSMCNGAYGYDSYPNYGNSYGMYGNAYGMRMGIRDDAESRFIHFAEESSRNAFANVEAVVRAFNGIAMMLDNTFFAMTSSFRAVLGVAENFGRLRSMFGHIWQAVNVFRIFTWLHKKLLAFLGVKPSPSSNSRAWNEALSGIASEATGSNGSGWPTFAFFGILLSAPYFISKLLPKYEDKCDPEKWKNAGIPAKAAFDFPATSANELTLHTNDEILLAPKSVQDEMRLSNSGWAYATCNGHSGVIPLNYIVIVKKAHNSQSHALPIAPIINNPHKKVQKRVSFGETQIFEPPAEIQQPEPSTDCSLQNNARPAKEKEIKTQSSANESTKGILIDNNKRSEGLQAEETTTKPSNQADADILDGNKGKDSNELVAKIEDSHVDKLNTQNSTEKITNILDDATQCVITEVS